MIARALVLALSCACALALAPLAAPADDDCALYLTGPGRSSAYDYSLNLLKGNFGYEGQHTCITYEAINQAYLDARNRILVSQPKGDWKAEDFASVGELVLDISINLARTYGLTYEEIEKGLPLIDTSRTLIREVCPPVFSHVECRAGKYRRLDGLCNNLRHPTWGATMAPFQRLIGPLFADGINAPRIAHNGHDLPLSRVVSRTMHPDEGFHDHAGTVMVIAWGQFMDHDYTLTGTPLDPINRNDPEECCKRPPHLKHPYCNEIRVPDDDYFYRLWGVKCIDFVRGFPSPRPGCRLGSRVPFNTLTGAIDGNTVYGVTEKFARKLRTGYGGLLRMNPVFKEYGLKDLLPLKLDIPDEGCTRPNKNMYCFEAGEIRVNEQLVLTVMHTLMAREHNRVAEALAAVNPHWDDETLYQEARRINIAEIQHITYNEFLPILLGKDVMEKFGLVLEKEGYWDGYDPEVNPDVLASFAAAAYRFGHSLLPTAVERWSKAHKFIASKRLSDLIRRPYDLYRAGVLDEYVMGLMNQVAQAMDDSITQEVTNHLFKKIGARFGMDLVSFNMQRGREFGLPGYMEFRKFCGLSGAETFQDLFGSMSNETVLKYETIFEHPIDVDLWSGGVSERPLPGSMLGPTFACIIATQFSYSRRGDRFWFELPNQPSSFTPEQLVEIRKSRLARVICDNTDIIDTVQLYPMVLPDHELNPRVPCRSGIIPSMDFSKWAEPVPFHGAKQFMTDAIAANQNTVSCSDTTTTNISAKTDAKGILCKAQNITNSTTVLIDKTSKISTKQTLKSANNAMIDNCATFNNATNTCEKYQSNMYLIKNKDNIPNYLYKTSSISSIPNKSKGHSKNSLERKRRSLESDLNFDSNSARPASVDYTTLHDVEQIEKIESPQHKSKNVIKKADLANFNIETLHEDIPTNIDKAFNQSKPLVDTYNFKKSSANKEDDVSKELHLEQQEVKKIDSSENTSKESVESDEIAYVLKPKTPSYIQNIDDSEKYSDEISKQKDKESNESGTVDHSHNSYKDNREVSSEEEQGHSYGKSNSNENEDLIEKPNRDNQDENPKHNKDYLYGKANYNEDTGPFFNANKDTHDVKSKLDIGYLYGKAKSNEDDGSFYSPNKDVQEVNSSEDTSSFQSPKNEDRELNSKQSTQYSRSNENSSENDKSVENSSEHSSENSSENSGKINVTDKLSTDKIPENYEKKPVELIPPKILHDVDLGNFNYERTPVKDQVIHSKEIVKNNYSNELIESTTIQPETIKSSVKFAPLAINDDSSSGEHLRKPNEEPIHFNDGEVKPVVELNSEDESSESSEETATESQNGNLKTSENNTSEEEQTRDVNEKFVAGKNNDNEKDNVKQQFERIPLDYKHEEKKNTEKETKNKDYEDKNKDNNDENINDGTLDAFTPKVNGYDDNLNIKFDNIAIKLPEINLPDDILSYSRIGRPRKEKKKEKKTFFHFGDDDSAENSEEQKQSVADVDKNHGSFNLYNNDKSTDHEHYKTQIKHGDNDDEDEDLYEKFVRERFGKKTSFGKRSEKLQATERNLSNPKLLETIQNILKKTERIQEDAEKSGDPKAGYMWTLEYGENL